MIKVIPSILSNSPNEVRQMLYQCQDAGVERVHIDIIDGVFTNNKTTDPSVLEEIETTLRYDIHLMVKEPINWIEKCIRAGADRIIGQIEMMNSQQEFIQKIQGFGIDAGLAIDLKTPIGQLDDYLLPDVDLILVMSVATGFGGQEFNTSVLEKIKQLNAIRTSDKTPFKICDDGGVTTQTVDDVAELEVDEVVVGRKLFENDLAQNIQKFIQASNRKTDQ
ncbi:MAG: ribulose-phosphate 3-epimerase [Patescibacteria group bacterium]